jgi:hypothetical protein
MARPTGRETVGADAEVDSVLHHGGTAPGEVAEWSIAPHTKRGHVQAYRFVAWVI